MIGVRGRRGDGRGGHGNENMIYTVLGQLFGSEGKRGTDAARAKGNR